MGTPQHSRTAGHTTFDKTWTPARPAPAVVVPARDGRGLTALRVITYVLVSLTCLVILAGVVVGAVLVQQLPALHQP